MHTNDKFYALWVERNPARARLIVYDSDPLTLALSTALGLGTSAAASYLQTRGAARLEPMGAVEAQ